ncbi:hypothetical protein GGS21DRAFT_14559 [Xylaria nigripes]|nr:hypothetical protein GGS21DRAFT_14559 [Xylaria nigripes]
MTSDVRPELKRKKMNRERWVDQFPALGSLRALGRELTYPTRRVSYSGPSHTSQYSSSSRQTVQLSRYSDHSDSSTVYRFRHVQVRQGQRSLDDSEYSHYADHEGDRRYSTHYHEYSTHYREYSTHYYENGNRRADQFRDSMHQQRETSPSTPIRSPGSSGRRNVYDSGRRGSNQSSGSSPRYAQFHNRDHIPQSPSSYAGVNFRHEDYNDHESKASSSRELDYHRSQNLITFDSDEASHDASSGRDYYGDYDKQGNMNGDYFEPDDHDGYQDSTCLNGESRGHGYDEDSGPLYDFDEGSEGGHTYTFDGVEDDD